MFGSEAGARSLGLFPGSDPDCCGGTSVEVITGAVRWFSTMVIVWVVTG